MTEYRTVPIDLPRSGELVLYDTEHTAWEGSLARLWSEEWEHRELVELGAVRVAADDFRILAKFRKLTRPHQNPILSEYFTNLTGIHQDAVEQDGIPLPALLRDLADFGSGCGLFMANGDDKDVLDVSADLQGVSLPFEADRFVNLRPLLRQVFQGVPGKLTTGLLPQRVGLPVTGTLHSALDDAVALARTLAELRRTGRI